LLGAPAYPSLNWTILHVTDVIVVGRVGEHEVAALSASRSLNAGATPIPASRLAAPSPRISIAAMPSISPSTIPSRITDVIVVGRVGEHEVAALSASRSLTYIAIVTGLARASPLAETGSGRRDGVMAFALGRIKDGRKALRCPVIVVGRVGEHEVAALSASRSLTYIAIVTGLAWLARPDRAADAPRPWRKRGRGGGMASWLLP
jgi:hypothetical protein